MAKKQIANYTLVDTTSTFTYEDYKEWCEEMDEVPASENSSIFLNWCDEERQLIYESDMENLKYSAKANVPCLIMGTLGLWDGKHTIQAVRCETLSQAIVKCYGTCDDVKATMENGVVKVKAMHHDGTNYFDIMPLSAKGLQRTTNDTQRTYPKATREWVKYWDRYSYLY